MSDDNNKTIRSDGNTLSSGVNDDSSTGSSQKTVRAGSTIGAGFDPDKTTAAGGVISANTGISNKTQRAGSNVIGAGYDIDLTRLDENSAILINDKKYNLIKVISKNTGEAEVFLLQNEKGEKVIFKLYFRNYNPNMDLLKKFRDVQHEDIVTVFESDYFQNRFYELMEYAEGGSLLDYKPLKDFEKLKEIISETANALDFLHQNKIIHRDIKPGNIFYKNSDGTDILVGDFGISSLVEEGLNKHRTSTQRLTHTYAAPEIYRSFGGKADVGYASDFYSLGITLVELWAGKDPFQGFDPLEMSQIKYENAWEIPDDMPDRLKLLIRGITTVNESKRWGIDEIKRWLKGEDVPVDDQVLAADYPPFVFSNNLNGKKLVAHNPEELAQMIYDHPELGRKHLYRGTIGKWLEDAKDNELCVEIKDITEYQYQKDEGLGTRLAVYLLHPEFPYISVSGKKCTKKDELISELRANFDNYKSKLKNPKDDFYIYLTSKGGKKQGETFLQFFSSDPDEVALYRIIYSLESNQPFEKIDPSNKKKITAKDPKELGSLLRSYPDALSPYLFSGEIGVWAGFFDPEIEEKLNDVLMKYKGKNDKRAIYIAALALNKSLPYIGPTGNSCSTFKEMGEDINKNVEEYIPILKSSNTNFMSELLAFEWNGLFDSIGPWFDKKSGDHKNKPVYNDYMVAFKVIKTLKFDPFYEADGVRFNHPDDLFKASGSAKRQIQKELDDPNSILNAWISIFYHEYPFTKDNKYIVQTVKDYAQQLTSYLNFIEKLNSGNSITKRFKDATQFAQNRVKKEKRLDLIFEIEKVIVLLMPSLALAIISLYVFNMEENPLPGSVFSVGWNYFLAIMIPISILSFVFAEENRFSTGCIGGPIIGAIAAVVIYYIFYFLLSMPLILTAVLAVPIVFLAIDFYTNAKFDKSLLDQIANRSGGKPTAEQISYTFGNVNSVTDNVSGTLDNYASGRYFVRMRVWRIGIAAALTFIVLLMFVLFFDTRFESLFDEIFVAYNWFASKIESFYNEAANYVKSLF